MAASLSILFSFLLAVMPQPQAERHFHQFDILSIDDSDLPPGCVLKPLDGEMTPEFMTENPMQSDDRSMVGLVSGWFMEPSPDDEGMEKELEGVDDEVKIEEIIAKYVEKKAEKVEAVYSAVYATSGGDDIMVMGLLFKEPVTDAECEELGDNPTGEPVICSGQLVLLVYTYGDDRMCLEAVYDHLARVVAEGGQEQEGREKQN